MARFRFFLVLLLTVALDFSTPVPNAHGTTEVIEEFEEATHRHRGGRRPSRVVREPVTPSAATVAAVSERRPLRHLVQGVRRPAHASAPVRKQPPPAALSSSAPDAH